MCGKIEVKSGATNPEEICIISFIMLIHQYNRDTTIITTQHTETAPFTRQVSGGTRLVLNDIKP